MPSSRPGSLLLRPHGVRLPLDLDCLDRFRDWARSDAFPEPWRIDWLEGEVDIDMSPEDLNTHATLKVAIAGDLRALVSPSGLGVVVSDRMRLTHPGANLSCEPDVLLLLVESVESGRVRLVPRADEEEGRYVEIEGQADLVVECVSDSSKEKDTRRLRKLYHRAGVREYWIADGRGKEGSLTVLHHGRTGWSEAPADARGYRHSAVLGRRVRLVRRALRAGLVCWRLETRPLR